MLYYLGVGQAEQRIIQDCYRRKRPLPERIANAPDLLTGLELFFEAFIELNTCRMVGWGPGPIPFTAIADYAAFLGLTVEETEDLFYHVRKMDEAFLKWNARKSKEST